MWILTLKILLILIASFLAGAFIGAFIRRNFNFEVETLTPIVPTGLSTVRTEPLLEVNQPVNTEINAPLNVQAQMNVIAPHKNEAIKAMRLRGEQIADDITIHNMKVEGYKTNISTQTSTSELFTGYRTAQINTSKVVDTEIVKRPVGLFAPRNDTPDDLKIIKGIGPTNERKLNQIGIYHFDQIATWTEEEAEWINSFLEFPGRVAREEWIEQAKAIVNGVKI